MSIRVLAFVLLTSASVAIAAPPKSAHPKTDPAQTPAPESIDVDALARAKDGSNAPAEAPTPAPTEDAAAAPPPMATATPPSDDASVAAPVTATPPETSSPDASAAATASAPALSEPPMPVTNAAPGETISAPADAAAQSIAAGCQARATSLLDEAEKADYAKVTRDFDAKMRTALPAPKFKEAWESLAQFGKLNARGQAHLGAGEGYTVVMIPLIFEKANLVAQIACGSDGRIAGFYVKPIAKPEF